MTNSLELSSILRQTPFSNLYFIPWTANPSYTDMIIFPHFKPSSAAFSPFPLTTLYLIDKVITVLYKIFYLHLYAACSIKPITFFKNWQFPSLLLPISLLLGASSNLALPRSTPGPIPTSDLACSTPVALDSPVKEGPCGYMLAHATSVGRPYPPAHQDHDTSYRQISTIYYHSRALMRAIARWWKEFSLATWAL